MSSFAEMMKNLSSVTQSENGGRNFSSTGGGKVLDFYSSIGGMRNRSDRDIIDLYREARVEDPILADNCILYARDIRQKGLGERRIGRLLLHELATIDPDKIIRNLNKIVEAGRWDDLWVLLNTPVRQAVLDIIKEQLASDIEGARSGKSISLASKWLPSPNTSSSETRAIAKDICKELNISERTYRKTLSKLRKYIGVLERTMSDNEWTTIDFSKVSSIAMHRYIGAFNRRLPEQFAKYKEDLENGKAKVNANTLFPYDITQKFFKEYYKNGFWTSNEAKILNEIDEAQWKALPNYINEDYEIVCLCDVSGSMTCNNFQPIATSVGLTTYFAQRNKGAYHGKYLTFSSRPRFISLDDNASLEDTLRYVVNTDVGYSTNLDAAMSAIYSVAEETRDVPKALLVISDMEIDGWQGDYCDSIVSKWNKKYKAIGLESPKIILWNVESRHNTHIAPSSDKVAYVSGYGIGPFGNLKTLIDKSAYDAAVEILMQPQFCWN